MKKIIMKIKEIPVIIFIIKYVIPFLLPFILEIPNEHISDLAKGIILLFLIIVTYFFIYFLEKGEKEDYEEIKKMRFIRKAYSNAYELNERKRNYIVEYSYNNCRLEKNKVAPYNIHEYISEICNSFKNLISQMTMIEKEYISVSFIYRYVYSNANKKDKNWKWLIGRNQTMRTPLEQFVKKENTVFNSLINKKHTSVFYNDKKAMEQQGKYYMSARDKRHNYDGSIYGVKLMFGNNANDYVEGILILSTYGKKFVKSSDIKEIKRFERLVVDDVFPYYERLLEEEMGMLYLQHVGKG